MQKVDIQTIFDILKDDDWKNISLINLLKDDLYGRVYRHESAIAVNRNFNQRHYFFNKTGQTDFETLLNKLDFPRGETITLCAADEWMIPIIQERFKTETPARCNKYALLGKPTIPPPKHDCRRLQPENAEIVNQYWAYKNDTSLEYIRGMIRKRGGFIAYMDDQPVAWVMAHDDGSQGFSYVIKPYRRQGIAMSLSANNVNYAIERGVKLFTYVKDDNIPAISRVLKIGFEIVDTVYWIDFVKE